MRTRPYPPSPLRRPLKHPVGLYRISDADGFCEVGAVMKDLIKRLERAGAPCRILDAAIMRAVSGVEPERPRGKGGDHWYRAFDGRLITDGLAPKLTESIDVALTLVPEDATGVLMGTNKILGFPKAEVDVMRGRGQIVGNATAPTLALAICLAALRARANV